jgi:hypothetical protein
LTTAALVLAAVLAVAVVLVVARPFLVRSGRREADHGPIEERQIEGIRLAENRDRALGALKDLEFDHRTGKVSDEDYQRLIGPLRREAAEALAALDREDTSV